MIRRTSFLTALAFSSLLLCTGANAQLFRAYLAPSGNDANPCTLSSPCRLLPAALTAVASGGEIWMLDSANYNTGTVTIGKSVSILAVPGAVGSFVATNGGPALSITANGLTIALRNIVIGPVAGATPGTHGVLMTGDSSLSIEKSLIANVPLSGVAVMGTGRLKVTETMFRNNGFQAVLLQDGARGVVSSSQMIDNGNGGVTVFGPAVSTVTQGNVSDCLISGGSEGVFAFVSAGSVGRVSVTRTTIERTNNAVGAQTAGAGAIATAIYSASHIVDNNNAWFQAGTGSSVFTLGNNHSYNNTGSVGVRMGLGLD